MVIGHGMAVKMRHPETGEPLFVEDIGDFINWCCGFALKVTFWIKIGVITVGPNLMDTVVPKNQQGKVEMSKLV